VYFYAMQGTSVISTNLSIRRSFVGSIELFLEPDLDDPRLGLVAGGPPLRGVMLNEKDMADYLEDTGIGSSTEESGRWGDGGRRKERRVVS
jgi:hypothetical protein